MKLSAEKGSLGIETNQLAKIRNNILEKLYLAIQVLTNLKKLYQTISLSGNQSLLTKVFEVDSYIWE